jgi:hypothetical protein
MLAIAEAMEQNTIGTTTQNIRLMNTVPSGSRTVAPELTVSPSTSTTGHSQPTIQPATIPTSIVIRNQLFLKKDFVLLMENFLLVLNFNIIIFAMYYHVNCEKCLKYCF